MHCFKWYTVKNKNKNSCSKIKEIKLCKCGGNWVPEKPNQRQTFGYIQKASFKKE